MISPEKESVTDYQLWLCRASAKQNKLLDTLQAATAAPDVRGNEDGKRDRKKQKKTSLCTGHCSECLPSPQLLTAGGEGWPLRQLEGRSVAEEVVWPQTFYQQWW